MTKIGTFNTLRIARQVEFGIYLDGNELGDILMPKRYVPQNVEIGENIDAFIYKDSEDRLVATTETPLAQVGECAMLECTSLNRFGAFLNWGLPKDLIVPYNEQRGRMEIGKSYIVYVFLDKATNRIAATEKIEKHLSNTLPKYTVGQEVDLMIYDKTTLGYKAVINNRHLGVIYNNETYRIVKIGERCKGYIKQIREDDKIDLSLQRIGYERVNDTESVILKKLHENNGRMAVGDKTDAELIKVIFGCSKKTFKMTIGTMYKKGLITIENNSIRLN